MYSRYLRSRIRCRIWVALGHDAVTGLRGRVFRLLLGFLLLWCRHEFREAKPLLCSRSLCDRPIGCFPVCDTSLVSRPPIDSIVNHDRGINFARSDMATRIDGVRESISKRDLA